MEKQIKSALIEIIEEIIDVQISPTQLATSTVLDLGYNSLQMTILMGRIIGKFGVRVNFNWMFENTINELIDHVQSRIAISENPDN